MKLLAICLALLMMIPSCGDRRQVSSAVQEELYNGYLGLTVSVPEGWYVEKKNDTNMTSHPQHSDSYGALDILSFGDGTAFIELLVLENMPDESHLNYSQIMFFAEDSVDVFPALEDYIDVCILAYQELDEGYETTFLGQDEVFMGGEHYIRLTFLTEDLWDGTLYLEQYNICSIGNLYFTAYSVYRNDSALSESTVEATLEQSFAVAADSPAKREAPRASQTKSYYNGYLSLQVTVPLRGGYYNLNPINLTDTWDESADLKDLELFYYGDDGFNMDLLNIVTKVLPEEVGYAQLELYAEGFANMELEEYLDLFEEAMIADMREIGFVQPAIERGRLLLDGMTYEMLSMTTPAAADDPELLTREYYIAEVRGLFFVASLFYWPDDVQSVEAARNLLESTFHFEQQLVYSI